MTSQRSRRRFIVATAIGIFAAAGFGIHADDPANWFDQGPVATLSIENDLVFETDRHYTHGTKLVFLHRDGAGPGFGAAIADALPEIRFKARTFKLGYELGQNIYTPADTSTSVPLLDDRPYAGWLYFGLVLQRRGLTAAERLVQESFTLELGVVGPESMADKAQTWVHEVRALDKPQGWENQLKTEPGFNLKYHRAWLLPRRYTTARYFDFIPHAGASLGTIETSLRAGATVRAGLNLPDDFGLQTISSLTTDSGGRSLSPSTSRRGVHGFSTWEGRAVAYTVFLDGNVFRGSRSVSSEPLVAEWRSGLVLTLNRFEFGAAHVYTTQEFVGQSKRDRYGSLFLKWKF